MREKLTIDDLVRQYEFMRELGCYTIAAFIGRRIRQQSAQVTRIKRIGIFKGGQTG